MSRSLTTTLIDHVSEGNVISNEVNLKPREDQEKYRQKGTTNFSRNNLWSYGIIIEMDL